MVNYNDLIGVPFKNRGRDMNGMDCYGLAIEVFSRNGIKLPEYNSDFDDIDKISSIIKGEEKKSCWQKVSIIDIPAPCLITLRFGVPRPYVNHTAVYIGNGKFIHTRESVGVCIDRIASPAWKKCIEGYYVYKE